MDTFEEEEGVCKPRTQNALRNPSSGVGDGPAGLGCVTDLPEQLARPGAGRARSGARGGCTAASHVSRVPSRPGLNLRAAQAAGRLASTLPSAAGVDPLWLAGSTVIRG